MDESIIDKALDLGVTYFRNENYVKARDLFRKALELAMSYGDEELTQLRAKHGLRKYTIPEPDKDSRIHHPKYVRLLDNMSATYEKLGDLKKALSYAKKMVEVDPYNLKCYIRLGKILQKQVRDKQAYETYKLGLRRTKEAHESYSWEVSQKLIEIAKQQKIAIKRRLGDSIKENSPAVTESKHLIDPIEERNRLIKKARRQSPGLPHNNQEQRKDFVLDLPPELLILVLCDFTAKELFRITLACKSWRKRLLSFPQLFQRFILNSCTHRQLVKFCDFIERLSPMLTPRYHSLELLRFSPKFARDELKSVEIIFSRMRKIEVQKLILSVPNCSTSHLAKIMASNVQLCKALTSLSMILAFRADKPYEVEMLSQCENLRRLEVLVNSSVVPVNQGFVRTSSFIEPKMLPTWAGNLETFSLTCDQNKVKGFPFMTLVLHFPVNHLSKLFISGVTFALETPQFDWLANFRFLKELWFENNRFAEFSAFIRLLRDYPLSDRLEKLTFREDSIGTRVDLEEISEGFFYKHNFQSLREIDLMGSSISGLGLTRMVSYLEPNKLRKFNFGDCPHVKFQRVQVPNESMSLSPYDFLRSLPHLESLFMPQCAALTDDTMSLMTESVDYLNDLKSLDVSLNSSLTGASLYEFLKALRDVRSAPLEYLNIDGCASISHITVNMLRSQSLVKKLDCVYEREMWRRFGINSFKYQS